MKSDDVSGKVSVSKTGSAIETSGGTLHVQPYRPSRDSKQLLAKLTFVPRPSQLESSGQDAFRGFYVLFWICVGIMMIRTYVLSFEQTGVPISLTFFALFSKDALTLALSDAVLVGSTAISVPFVKMLVKGWIPYSWLGIVIQHTYQAIMLAIAVTWTFNRHWEWVQSGFFTLHCLVMLMKVHSYVSINGSFAQLYLRKQEFEKELRTLVESLPGGWKKAQLDANDAKTTAQQEQQDAETSSQTGTSEYAAGTPQPLANGVELGTQPMDQILRKRLAAIPPRNRADQNGDADTHTVPVAEGTPASLSANTTPPRAATPSYFPPSGNDTFPPKTIDSDPSAASDIHPLVGHPDERVDTLARSIRDLDDELTSTGVNGKGRVRFPQNVTLWNFVDYQIIPTLVYELEYPRTDKVRLSYVFEKTVAFLGTFTLLYTITEHYIIPLTPRPGQNFFRSLLDLALPFMLSYLLLFYIIFECICNGFAEISRFADRQFYEDWWNSTSQDEFARKWNKPVHSFLLRHVYASSISYHRLSKPSAAMVTFFLSALVHELVMAIVTKKIRMYLFGMQMAQVPLIALGRMPFIRRNKILGNVVFWLGLMTGFPLLCVAYCAY